MSASIEEARAALRRLADDARDTARNAIASVIAGAAMRGMTVSDRKVASLSLCIVGCARFLARNAIDRIHQDSGAQAPDQTGLLEEELSRWNDRMMDEVIPYAIKSSPRREHIMRDFTASSRQMLIAIKDEAVYDLKNVIPHDEAGVAGAALATGMTGGGKAIFQSQAQADILHLVQMLHDLQVDLDHCEIADAPRADIEDIMDVLQDEAAKPKSDAFKIDRWTRRLAHRVKDLAIATISPAVSQWLSGHS